ncbi:hypothetical protein JZ785_24635 [Alicyclobacillus curvatus]|jgi:ABC-type uncharacterized transport system auxiliary subunit|nr:hypothetical protein JZ785_24635 [Alicyclobacillus curvatus]
MGLTGEEVGYRDAIRQVDRSLQRRLRALETELESSEPDEHIEIAARIEEIRHIIQVVESLHR